MYKSSLLLLLLVLSVSLQAANTWYSTGLSSDWSNEKSWSLDSVILDQRGLPGTEDDLVIRHPLTLTLEEAYAHAGNIKIESEGVLEMFGRGEEAVFVFNGKKLINEGVFMTNLPVIIKGQDKGLAIQFIIAEGSQTLLGSHLTLAGKAQLQVLNGSCGAFLVKKELRIQGEDVFLLGLGSWIVEGGRRAWAADGNEITNIVHRDAAIAAQMEIGLSLYADITFCALDQRGVAGTLDTNVDINADSEAASIKTLSIYPNPQSSNDQVNVEGRGFGDQEVVFVEVRTLMGQRILAESTASNVDGVVSFQTSWNLNPGQYVVLIRGKQHVASHRLVCQ
ncbi:MAG: T9SS type A sorting domain-containing protein [Bacteroidia bacterium]|nr:T9SS type A sorting domain-containing protein [Bacteroidia bacterium]